MPFPDRRTINISLTTLIVAGVSVAIYSARRVILLFVFAVLFAYLIDPVVKFLQRHSLFFRNLRGPAVVEVYVSFVIVLAFLGYSLAPGMVRNTTKFMDQVPTLLDHLSSGDIAGDLGNKYGWTEEQELRLRFFLGTHKEQIQRLVPIVDRYLSNAALLLGWLFVIPILAIFFLRDGNHITDVLIQMFFPASRHAKIREVADELHLMLTCYIRAQVILCFLSFGFYATALLALRFPHALGLAFVGGLLEFVPVVGWASTLAVIVGVGIVSHSHWMWMALLLGVWRIIQDYVALPRIMGQQMKIHPLAAIFAVLVGAELGGIVGIYLAVPIMAGLRVILQNMINQPAKAHYPDCANVSRDMRPVLMETAPR